MLPPCVVVSLDTWYRYACHTACHWPTLHTIFQVNDSQWFSCSLVLFSSFSCSILSFSSFLSSISLPSLHYSPFPYCTLSSPSNHSFSLCTTHPLLTLSSALFIGCLKHGFLALKSIARDPSLPFHRPALERHIRATFLHGYGDTLPAAVDELRDIDMAGVCASVCVCMCVCKVLLEICITVFDFYSSILWLHISIIIMR